LQEGLFLQRFLVGFLQGVGGAQKHVDDEPRKIQDAYQNARQDGDQPVMGS
jgi:hypothetical protein